MQILDCAQRTEAWKKLRSQKIMASDASIIIKANPWKTPHQLWRQKLGLDAEEEENEAMRRGTALEPIALEYFSVINNMDFFKPAVVVSDKHSWMGASLDGLSYCKKYILEIKCGGEKLYNLAKNNEIPPYYYAQIQHQLAVTELDMCYYFVYYEGDGITLEIKRDDDYIKYLIAEEEKFYNCLQNLVAPELTDKDYQKKEDEKWQELAKIWKHATKQIKYYETIERQVRQDLIALAGQSNAQGAGIKLSKCIKKGTIDYKKLVSENNINEEQYRKDSIEYFTIRATDED